MFLHSRLDRGHLRGRLLALAALPLSAMSVPTVSHAQAALVPVASDGARSNESDTAASYPVTPPAAAPGSAPEGSVGGMGDVNLYPKRVVMTDRERTATIGLYNRAAANGEYEISVTDMLMQPDGRLIDLASADPAQAAKVKSASAMLRWSPRRVTLPANEAQLVRIMARVPPDLPPGEYRAHFSAVSTPPETGDVSIGDGAITQNNGVGVQIIPRFGISIPIIVRVGETTLTTGLAGLAVTRPGGGAPSFALRITREGTRSAFGNISVTSTGAKKPIGEVKGVGVYTEINERSVQVPIDPQADPALYAKGARLTVTYTDDELAPGKILARQEFTVP